MAEQTIRLVGGADEIATPTLNEGGISVTNLVRFWYEPRYGSLIGKLGGWSRFFAQPTTATVRALWAWQDLNFAKHLAYGTQNVGNTTSAQLSVITGNSSVTITPTSTTDNVVPQGNTTSGNATVLITDATTANITSSDSVFIETHLSVGGLVLYGMYPTTANATNAYTVQATDILGNPVLATSTTGNTSVAQFTVANTTNVVTVNLPNHGYSPGSTYPCLVSTTVANVTIYGQYFVQTVPDPGNFTIFAAENATGNATAGINGNMARYTYSFGVDAIAPGSGFGSGAFGSGGFGTGTGIKPSVGTAIPATDWTMDNWGEILLACPVNGTLFQPIYYWDPTAGAAQMNVISTAPTVNDGIFVAMPQRQIVAWGSTVTGIQDPLLINWCDVNNLTTWVDLPTNQAGSYRIPRGSRIVGGLQTPNQGLIWTDLDLWAMQYIGPPYVYGFNQIGSGCGLIGRKAACTYNGAAYWMGPSQFYQLTSASSVSAGGVAAIPCPIWDVMFQELDQGNLTKIRAAVNSRFNEVAWFYPTNGSNGEVSNYLKLNTQLNVWDYGTIGRSAWIDQSPLGPPIGADPASLYIYQHETSPDADGQPLMASFQTGFYSLGDSFYKTFVDEISPDAKYGYYGNTTNATLMMTVYVADYAEQTPQTFGPYTLTQASTFINTRLRGKLISFGFASNDVGTWWRLGGVRYRYIPDGRY
jgi:hypothetical protein